MSDIKYKLDHVNEEGNYVGKVNLPKPPKPGEYIICQMCGNPILPKELSKDAKIRKRELKWHIHNRCYTNVDAKLDELTPGLIHSRYGNKNSLHRMLREELNKKENE